jgi:hypothetical protein
MQNFGKVNFFNNGHFKNQEGNGRITILCMIHPALCFSGVPLNYQPWSQRMTSMSRVEEFKSLISIQ